MRIATARFYNGCVPAKKWVIVVTIANPQSRDFKRQLPKESIVKFDTLTPSGDTVQFDYGNVFFSQPIGDNERLVIGPTSGQIALLCDLTSVFPEHKYYLLYVLLLSHAGNREGRYQSPLIESYEDLELFLWTFQTFFEEDGRHHI